MQQVIKVALGEELPAPLSEFIEREEQSILKFLQDGVHLLYKDGKLAFCQSIGKMNPLIFDFDKLWSSYQQQRLSIKKEMLPRAMGWKKRGRFKILDGSFGTGKDSLLCLYFEGEVRALERNPVIYLLAKDALLRVKNIELAQALTTRFSLEFGDLFTLTDICSNSILYFDPMYNREKIKALPRKEMVYFHEIVGNDSDSEQIFTFFKKSGQQKLVIKRPLHGEILGGMPRHQIKGKSTRFDVYFSEDLFYHH